MIPLDLTFSLRRARAVRLTTTDIPLRLQNQIDTFVSAVSALLNGDSHA